MPLRLVAAGAELRPPPHLRELLANLLHSLAGGLQLLRAQLPNLGILCDAAIVPPLQVRVQKLAHLPEWGEDAHLRRNEWHNEELNECNLRARDVQRVTIVQRL